MAVKCPSSEPYVCVYGFTSFAFHTMINHDKLNQRRPSMAMGITEQKIGRERDGLPSLFLRAKFLCILPCFIFSESQLENPQSQEIFKVVAAANCHFCTQTLPT